jgi:hypothetical protein
MQGHLHKGGPLNESAVGHDHVVKTISDFYAGV